METTIVRSRRAAAPSVAHTTILVATARPAVRHYFTQLATHRNQRFVVRQVPVDPASAAGDAIAGAALALLDPALDAGSAILLCSALRARRADLPIAAIQCCPGSPPLAQLVMLLRAGATGLLSLDLSDDELARTLDALLGGHAILSVRLPAGEAGLLQAIMTGRAPAQPDTPQLTERARTLLQLLTQGHGDKQLARALGISPNTVKEHVARWCRATGSPNRTALAAWAARHGF
jgi:DNA-binding NarL/FixJ family response regulator